MKQENFYSGEEHPGLVDIARYPYPGSALPSSFRLTPDGKSVTYLFSAAGDMNNSLWVRSLDTDKATAKLLWDVSETLESRAKESLEEALLKERLRQRNSGITSYSRVGSGSWILITFQRNLHLVHDETGERRTLTSGQSPCLDPKISPDIQTVGFVRDGELWSVPVVGGKAVQLTLGDPGTTRGVADYIAQEEMGRSSGYFWAPDSQSIAILEADERHIDQYPIVHQGKDDVVVEHHRYPFAGAENPKVRLGVIAAAGGAINWIKLADHYGHEIYIPRVGWFKDGSLAVQTENREQTWLELLEIKPEASEIRCLVREDAPDAWINLHNGFVPLKSGSFLWLSERSGFQHISVHGRDGSKERDLTSGDWMVTSISTVDESLGQVFFTATKESPIERHLYSVPLDGGDIRKISQEAGCHGVTLQSGQSFYLDTLSSCSTPPRVVLFDLEGVAQQVLFESAAVDLRSAKLSPPELLEFENRVGVPLHGAFYRAKNMSGEARPLIVHVYGGPHAQRVLDAWGTTIDMRAQYWTHRGFHVLRLDNRGSANRGLAFETALRHETGRVEVDDQVDGVRFLIDRGDVDEARVGVTGWSYGGYMACMCLIRAPEVFKAAVSGAPVTHWDGYDTHYTERYMGMPQSNVDGYRDSGVLSQAGDLQGKLMLVHGLIDENVHFRHTARLINALIKHDKDYELLLFPDERHMPRDESARLYLERRMTQFFEKNL
jgi:dipeptidyl-peptidase 4